ncbi:MAG: NADP-dependent oxidoreductase [Myxococcaceae bacterium]|nr:NADP-dependent oxidoreductase [Myxococcaceae bacterium]
MTSADNKTITLCARPNGWVLPEHFALERRDAPTLSGSADGKVVVRTLYLSVDPYMRGRMNDAKSYVAPFELGKPILSAAIGEVVAAPPASKFEVGARVSGMWGWQELALVDEKALRLTLPGVPLPLQLGLLGMPGMTAYVGLLDIGKPKPGETVFVSGAAGAVGSTVGQLAKLHGCRAVGSAGSDEKVRYLLDELGFDAAYNYKTCGDQRRKLRELCPSGIDVYFDNVGGETLEAALFNVNIHARIPVCGMVSVYNEAEPAAGPRNLMLLVQQRVLVQGFLVSDHGARAKQFGADMSRWLSEGKLKHRETIVDGIEQAPAALIGMLRGQNVGKMLVRVAQE